MTSFGGTCPYFWLCLLFIWQDPQDLTYDRIVLRITSSTSRHSLSLQDMSGKGVGGDGDTN
jgi:hypothetical protein